MEKPAIVFIHGAGLGAWIWEEVIAEIDNPCLALDFPNRAKSTQDLSLADYNKHIVQQIDAWNHENFVIVAHSIGGIFGLMLCAHYGNRVLGFAALSATIPASGGSFISCLPWAKRIALSLITHFAGTKPPKEEIEKSLCNGLNLKKSEQVISKFVPESRSIYIEACGVEVPEVKLTGSFPNYLKMHIRV